MTREDRTALELKRLQLLAQSAADLASVALEHAELAANATSVDDAFAHRGVAMSAAAAALKILETQ